MDKVFVDLEESGHSDWVGAEEETKNDDFKNLKVKSKRGLQSAPGTWTGLNKGKKKKKGKKKDTK